jgi:predicted site-specific integrase-resolvase
MYVPPRVAAKHYSVTVATLGNWRNRGDIDSITTPGGQHRYKIVDDSSAIPSGPTEKSKICYCRVSSAGQRDDMLRQVEFMRSKFPEHEIITDIASGINYKRPGLKAILRRSMQGTVAEVVVAHRDRLARFGYELLEFILAENGTELVCDSAPEHRSTELELAEDIISIITVFSARVFGARKYNKSAKGCIASKPPSGRKAEAVDGMHAVDV